MYIFVALKSDLDSVSELSQTGFNNDEFSKLCCLWEFRINGFQNLVQKIPWIMFVIFFISVFFAMILLLRYMLCS